MEYKERYEKALEIARKLHKYAIYMEDNFSTKQIEMIFPELAGLEDVDAIVETS